jgi:hypothetical protein
MYTVWNVTFRIKPDNRGPCDPLFRTEPPTRGSVGDEDPFSEAFGRSLTKVDDPVHLRSIHYEQPYSISSDASDFFSLQSPTQDSLLTPNTEHSTFSPSEGRCSAAGQLYHQPASLTRDDYARNTEAWTRPRTLTHQLDIATNVTDYLPPTHEHQSENDPLNTTRAPLVAKVESKPANTHKQKPTPISKRKRKGKAPLSRTRRPPAKTRQQHLSDNKAAASRCRHQRKACETQLQETSLMLQASIKVSKSNINELGIELASLRRKLWECPDCTDRYLYNLGPESNEIHSDRSGAETVCTHRPRP